MDEINSISLWSVLLFVVGILVGVVCFGHASYQNTPRGCWIAATVLSLLVSQCLIPFYNDNATFN